MRRVVLIGSGTAVGKTYVAEALARALASRGLPIQALKPLETGLDLASWQTTGAPPPGTDAERLEQASSAVRPPRPHPFQAFSPPLSPHLAAAHARATISIPELTAYCSAPALADTTCQLIETAGGVLSPLNLRETNFDFARALDPALWVLVAPDALGVLHDVRATLLAMTALGRAPDALVLSAARPPDLSTGTNASELARLGIVPPPTCVLRAGHPEDIEPLALQALRHSPAPP
jgi:dethiobiotin synthase